jgi:MoaA/NifB/PqqE/SkfB family radical SAM enzyme
MLDYQKQSVHSQDILNTAEAKGESKKAIEIAKNLLSQNIDINTISVATGLNLEEILKLKNKN